MTTDRTGSADRGAPGDHRRRPRRRGEVLHAAILEAALAELGASGWAGFRMDAVAERARVSKASLYRRWPGKPEIVAEAAYTRLPDPTTLEDTGSLRGDLLAAFRDLAARLSGPAGAALRGMLSDALADPQAAHDLRRQSRGRGVAILTEIVGRAGRRGELDPEGVTPRQLEVGHAMLRHQFLLEGRISDDYILGLVDEVILPLLGARGAASR